MKRFLCSALAFSWLASTGPLFASSGRDWSAYLGDSGASHYSTLTGLTPSNVGRLQKAWEYRTGGVAENNRSQIQCNPLVVDGVLYGTSPQLKLFAVDAATGAEKWTFEPTDARGGLNRSGDSYVAFALP